MSMTFATNINPNNSTHSLGSSSYKWLLNGYAPEIIVVTVTASNNTSVTVSDSNITGDHIVINQNMSIPNDVTYTTASGSITLSCSEGIPAMTILLGVKV